MPVKVYELSVQLFICVAEDDKVFVDGEPSRSDQIVQILSTRGAD